MGARQPFLRLRQLRHYPRRAFRRPFPLPAGARENLDPAHRLEMAGLSVTLKSSYTEAFTDFGHLPHSPIKMASGTPLALMRMNPCLCHNDPYLSARAKASAQGDG